MLSVGPTFIVWVLGHVSKAPVPSSLNITSSYFLVLSFEIVNSLTLSELKTRTLDIKNMVSSNGKQTNPPCSAASQALSGMVQANPC